jgi:hypothetical protein
MSVPRVPSLGAIITLAVLFGSPTVARAHVSPPDAGDAGDAGASDPPEDPPADGGSVGGGGGCTIGRSSSALELPSLGLVAAGAALLAASRRRRAR